MTTFWRNLCFTKCQQTIFRTKTGKSGQKSIKIVLFSKSWKWHDTNLKEFKPKLGDGTCSFPNLEALKQLKIEMRLFFESEEVSVLEYL